MKNQFLNFIFLAGLAAAPASCLALPVPADIPLTQVVTGLISPVGVLNAGDGSNRLFVIQQGGQVRVIRNNGLLGPAFMTVSGATQCAETAGGALQITGFTAGGERGLLGMAFHPDYENNGQFFLSYTDGNGDSILTRITMQDLDADVVIPDELATCLVILRVDQDFSNHNGGHIAFGPDGYLYFGLGDGGNANDPCNRAQTLDPVTLIGATSGGDSTDENGGNCAADDLFIAVGGNADSRALLGKMLRLDINDFTDVGGANGLCGARADGAANYAIPVGNPFAGNDAQSACDEVWLYGLRNPWRWSFDRLTGDLIIGDVGQDHWEEINLLPAASSGNNMGWDVCEGTQLAGQCNQICNVAGATAPIIEYINTGATDADAVCDATTTSGSSVTGGYRYRGPDAALQGVYFYGDAVTPGLRFSEEDGASWVAPTAASIVPLAGAGIFSFGEDEGGAVYFVSGGTLTRIGGLPPLFADGFESP